MNHMAIKDGASTTVAAMASFCWLSRYAWSIAFLSPDPIANFCATTIDWKIDEAFDFEASGRYSDSR